MALHLKACWRDTSAKGFDSYNAEISICRRYGESEKALFSFGDYLSFEADPCREKFDFLLKKMFCYGILVSRGKLLKTVNQLS